MTEPPKREARNPCFPVAKVRAQFPALRLSDFIFFDNAAGAQVPQGVLDAVNRHLLGCNVQRGGRYPKSVEVDAAISRARESVAVLVNSADPREIAFGMNATSFIRLISLAIGGTLDGRNEIVLTDLDHEANIGTWLALSDGGAAQFRWWRVREDGGLHADDLRPLLSGRTRLVACTAASNALGSLVDIQAAAALAHEFGAELFVDCVHYGPHGPIDVRKWDCDYLVCSGYKIFAPHMGFLWGRLELLRKLRTFREDFIPDEPPGKIEAGTFIYENVAGMDAAIRYLEEFGQDPSDEAAHSRRAKLAGAMSAVGEYEDMLSAEMLRVLRHFGAQIYGFQKETEVHRRVPTFLFNVSGVAPQKVTEALAQSGIGVRDGHMYAPRLMERLGLRVSDGAVRASLVHYNTTEEIHQFANALRELPRHG
jgi:cysteine desulfurase family protein (TIGR01976 family)